MALEVIGAGFGRTGTLSMKLALERLGFERCYHMVEVIDGAVDRDDRPYWLAALKGEPVDWDSLFTDYRACMDWPACNSWRELAAHWPQAKILLTERDPQDWYRSVMNTIYPGSLAMSQDPGDDWWPWTQAAVWDHCFEGRMDDEAFVIERFVAHNQAVKDEVPADRLLIYRPGDGWEPLCRFLGRDAPDEPFPHTNTTEEFNERLS